MKKSYLTLAQANSVIGTTLVDRALHCLETRLRYGSKLLSNSQDVSAYARLQLADEPNEVFAVFFLDCKLKLLSFDKLFFGTVNQAVVYPRRIVQKVLEHNAANIILVHNHPSGNCHPSDADIHITREISKILAIIDVHLVDHIIVSQTGSYSFAEKNLLQAN